MSKPFGRPAGSGEYPGPCTSKSYRMTLALAAWLTEQGGRKYLESLVPLEFRKKFERKQKKLSKENERLKENIENGEV